MFRWTTSTVPGKALRLPEPGKWTTGLYECFISIEEADAEGCELVWVFPSIMHARVAKAIRGDNYRLACCTYAFAWTYCAWLFAAPVRRQLREKYDLPQEPCSDCMAHAFCSPCAVWQEHREMEAREGARFFELDARMTDVSKSAKAAGDADVAGSKRGGVDAGPPDAPASRVPSSPTMAWQPLESDLQQGQGQVQGQGQGQGQQGGEVQPAQQVQQQQVRPTSAPRASAGGVWRKLNPADSYVKRSADFTDEEKGGSGAGAGPYSGPAPAAPAALPTPMRISGAGNAVAPQPPPGPRVSGGGAHVHAPRPTLPPVTSRPNGHAWAPPSRPGA